MNINLFPQKIIKINLYLIFFLLFSNLLGIVSRFYFNLDTTYGLIKLFNFNMEKNIPTFYSSVALLICSVLLLSIALTHKKYKSPHFMWLGLSAIFLFLSIDEISSIHEMFNKSIRETLGTSGFLFYAWIIPYGIALIVFIVSYSKFLFQLPKNTMVLFLVSGATFISGAIGFEMFGGRHAELFGRSNILYAFYYTCEEFLEMIGIAMFIYTLLSYSLNQFGSIKVTISKN